MSGSRCKPACYAFVRASSEFAFQPPRMHMYHLLLRSVWFGGEEVKLGALLSPRSCLKKMCCSVSLAVDDAGPTCCSFGLCKRSSLITIRKLSLNSLAPWVVWRAKNLHSEQSLGNIRAILIHTALRREQCLGRNRVLSV